MGTGVVYVSVARRHPESFQLCLIGHDGDGFILERANEDEAARPSNFQDRLRRYPMRNAAFQRDALANPGYAFGIDTASLRIAK